ncbi:MAG TPA: hypothetical protein VNW90_10660 [Acetobacteraceae bacterium]|nr:hypothetical protein [Acetobacteraceae bacterium]
MGAMEQGKAAQQQADYQAQVANNNAIIAQQNATYATAAGNAQAEKSAMGTAERMGAIRAAQASSGVDVGSGSPLDVQTSQKEVGQLDQDTIRNNAARVAYGYRSQSTNFTAQAGLDTATGANAATAGDIGAVSSVLGGATSVGKQFSDLTKVGVIGSGAPNVSTNP